MIGSPPRATTRPRRSPGLRQSNPVSTATSRPVSISAKVESFTNSDEDASR
jgi:hypothetical protein